MGAGSDWIKQDQCRTCTVDETPHLVIIPQQTKVTVDAKTETQCGPYGCCHWQTTGCLNSQGFCNKQCDWTEWSSDANPVCTCGPAGSDWIKQNQCRTCTVDETPHLVV